MFDFLIEFIYNIILEYTRNHPLLLLLIFPIQVRVLMMGNEIISEEGNPILFLNSRESN